MTACLPGAGRATCPCCDHDPALAVLLAAAAAGDLDVALDAGLLHVQAGRLGPDACAPCRRAFAELLQARDARRAAWSARDRYRTRVERLARARAVRDAARAPAVAPGQAGTTLPAGAAAALARALARAAPKR